MGGPRTSVGTAASAISRNTSLLDRVEESLQRRHTKPSSYTKPSLIELGIQQQKGAQAHQQMRSSVSQSPRWHSSQKTSINGVGVNCRSADVTLLLANGSKRPSN